MQRRKTLLWMALIVLLLLMLLGLTYFLAAILDPPGSTPPVEKTDTGITMRWIRSIYGLSANAEDRLISPVGLGVSPAGDVYVPQSETQSVMVFSDTGAPIERFTNENIASPSMIGFGPGGRRFIADELRGMLVCFDSNMNMLWETSVFRADDLVIVNDRIYVVGFDRVQVFDLDGNALFEWGERGYEQGEFDFPHGIEAIGETLVVADGNNARVQAFSLEGSFLWETGIARMDPASAETSETRHFQLAAGMAVTPDDRILVTDPLNFDIVAFDSDGELLGRVGGYGSADGKFSYPSDIEHLSGNLYVVSDTGANRLQIVEITFGDQELGIIERVTRSLNIAWCVLPIALILLVLVAIAASRGGSRKNSGAGASEPEENHFDQETI